MLRSILLVIIALSALPLSAQVTSKRFVHVTVTDPSHRFVTGLDRQHFEILENGVRRVITDFANPDYPISLAIVNESPLTDAATQLGPEVELIQTSSMAEAIRRLSISKNAQKAVIIASTNVEKLEIPGGIRAFLTDPTNLMKSVVELRNQYMLVFESSSPSANFEIVLKQPSGLPTLTVNRK